MGGVIGFLNEFISGLLHLLYDFGQGVIALLITFVRVLLHLLYGVGRGVIEFLFVPILQLLYDFFRFLTKTLNRRVDDGLILPLALAVLLLFGYRGGGRAAGKMMKAPGEAAAASPGPPSRAVPGIASETSVPAWTWCLN